MKVLSINPLVALVDDVLDANMAKNIIDTGAPYLKRAEVAHLGAPQISEYRTNRIAKINRETNPHVMALTQRVSELVNLPVENAEEATLMHYQGDQEFKPHFDAFGGGSDGWYNRMPGGQRVYTTIFYLNSLAKGGETEFPNLNIQVKPKLGQMLLFSSTQPCSIRQHADSLHAGRPIVDQDKWALTIFWRQYARRETLLYKALRALF